MGCCYPRKSAVVREQSESWDGKGSTGPRKEGGVESEVRLRARCLRAHSTANLAGSERGGRARNVCGAGVALRTAGPPSDRGSTASLGAASESNSLTFTRKLRRRREIMPQQFTRIALALDARNCSRSQYQHDEHPYPALYSEVDVAVVIRIRRRNSKFRRLLPHNQLSWRHLRGVASASVMINLRHRLGRHTIYQEFMHMR